jgi:FAD/FMN-containing dehydrogenase
MAGSVPHVIAALPQLARALRAVVGEAHVLVDDDLRAPYETDWIRRWSGRAAAVVRPGTTEEVSAVVAACDAAGVAVVPQGGNTGMVGAGVPRGAAGAARPAGAASPVCEAGIGEPREQIVLSLARLNELGEVDGASMQVSAGAGVTLAALQAHARAAGLDAGVDFGARDSAMLGGLAACDAGGIRALRHGTVRARVAGLEAVLADGTVVRRMSGLLKDNAGYDLPALLVGSEGTLGVITRVRWRLVPRHDARALALVPLPSLAHAAPLLRAVRPRLPSLDACEFLTDEGLGLVLDHLRLPAPLEPRSPAYVLPEAAADADPLPALAAALEAAGVEDALIADDSASRERLWRLREAHTEAISAAGVPHKLDVGVPLDALAPFCDAVRKAMPAGARTILFGHLGDGNVHVNVLGPDPADETVDEIVLGLVAEHGGTISAEHGVGVAKARFLHLTRSPDEIAAMRAIKAALDPRGTLNPGAVLAERMSTAAG